MIMYEITYLNATKYCTNVLKNIYIIQVYQIGNKKKISLYLIIKFKLIIKEV